MFEKIKSKFMKPKTLQERYVAFMKTVQDASKKHGIDLVPALNIKDLFAEPTPTPAQDITPEPTQEIPKSKKGGKKSGK